MIFLQQKMQFQYVFNSFIQNLHHIYTGAVNSVLQCGVHGHWMKKSIPKNKTVFNKEKKCMRFDFRNSVRLWVKNGTIPGCFYYIDIKSIRLAYI